MDAIANVVDDRFVFFTNGQVDQVAEILAHHRLVGGHYDDLEAVDLLEFESLGIGGTGHARQLVIETKVILKGNRRYGLVFVLYVDSFLGFNCLVQALGPAPTRHGAAGKFIDDNDGAVLHNIVDVTGIDRMRPERGV